MALTEAKKVSEAMGVKNVKTYRRNKKANEPEACRHRVHRRRQARQHADGVRVPQGRRQVETGWVTGDIAGARAGRATAFRASGGRGEKP